MFGVSTSLNPALGAHLNEQSFMLPAVENVSVNTFPSKLLYNIELQPAEFCRMNYASGYDTAANAKQEVKFAKGTTTLAFKYNGGIIVSVDSRSTMGPYIGKLRNQ
jgi:hypothetical protein